ncbi:MAG: hypothetical protein WBX01_09015 [Nitrososphaeraceae archaeon]
MEERCNLFAAHGIKDPRWAFHCIIKFLQSQRERVETVKRRFAQPSRLNALIYMKDKMRDYVRATK